MEKKLHLWQSAQLDKPDMKHEFGLPHHVMSPLGPVSAIQVSAGVRLAGRFGVSIAANLFAPAPRFDAPIRVGELAVTVIGCRTDGCNAPVNWIERSIDDPVVGKVETSFLQYVDALVADAQAVIVHGLKLPDVLPVIWRARTTSPRMAIIVALPVTSPAERAELMGNGADDIIDHTCPAEEAAARLRACCKRYAAFNS